METQEWNAAVRLFVFNKINIYVQFSFFRFMYRSIFFEINLLLESG